MKPRASVPTRPEPRCTPTTSRESSKPYLNFSSTNSAEATPDTRPRPIAAAGLMLAHDGVMATRPATAPDAAPREVGCPCRTFSVRSQLSMAAQGVTSVLTQISPACSAVVAAPALNPNQPNQRTPAPSMMNGTLCGRCPG